MIDWAKYTSVKYDAKHYNCLHFAVDIYKDLTGQDMGLFVTELMTDEQHRNINPDKLKNFVRLDTPCETCLVVMRGASVHAGIYHQNAIIHLTDFGIQSVPPHIAEIQHGSLSYYRLPHSVKN